ncbi:MAG: CpaE family protein [Burkholderiaceae bacterium]
MNVSAIAFHQDRLDPLADQLEATGLDLELSVAVGGVDLLIDQIQHQACDLIVAEVSRMQAPDRVAIAEALQANPACKLLLISADYSAEFLLWAMRGGIGEVVPAPAELAELKDAVMRQLKRSTAGANPRAGAPRAPVTAFLPAKGGSGATFLATNAAAALAARGKRVAVIDLNLNLGDAAMFLTDETPNRSIADVCQDIDRLDGEMLEASMTKSGEQLWILPAPESPEAGIDIDPAAIDRVIELARDRFDHVVIDAGRVLDARILRGLDVAQTIYMVMQLALPYVHDAKRLKAMFEGLGYASNKLRLIVNRYERGTDIGVGDVEASLQMPVSLKVPNDFKTVTYAINHAIPVFEHRKRGAVIDAIAALSNQIDHEEKPTSRLRKAFGMRSPLSLAPSRG